MAKRSINIDTEVPSYSWWIAGALTVVFAISKVFEIGLFDGAQWWQVLIPLIIVAATQLAMTVLGLIVLLGFAIVSAFRK